MNISDQINKAKECYKEKKLDECISLLEKVLEQVEAPKKERVEAYLIGGSALRQQQKLPQAINALKKGLEEFPNQPGILHNLGNCYRDQGGGKRWIAHDCYQQSLKGDNSNESALIAAIKNLLELSFPGLAYEMLQEWLESRKQSNIPGMEIFTILLELAGRVLEPEQGNPIADWCIEALVS